MELIDMGLIDGVLIALVLLGLAGACLVLIDGD